MAAQPQGLGAGRLVQSASVSPGCVRSSWLAGESQFRERNWPSRAGVGRAGLPVGGAATGVTRAVYRCLLVSSASRTPGRSSNSAALTGRALRKHVPLLPSETWPLVCPRGRVLVPPWQGGGACRALGGVGRGHVAAAAFASEREKEDWMKRQQESGGGAAAPDGGPWRWTLNWSPIVPGILVGSCPRSPGDIDRIADEAGASALVNLQSDACFEALQIPFPSIKQRAAERGVVLERVPVRDFDHGDQAFMLPQAVRMVNLLLARGHIVYIHCTAGINRASLTALGYLTFVKGMELDAAMRLLKAQRPIVHPYLDCWHSVRGRLLSGRDQELLAVASEIYNKRAADGSPGDSASDWRQAQSQVISGVFEQYLTVDVGKLEADEKLWEWQHRGEEEARQQKVVALAEAAGHELEALVAEAEEIEEELKGIQVQALTKRLLSQAASSKLLRLENLVNPPPGHVPAIPEALLQTAALSPQMATAAAGGPSQNGALTSAPAGALEERDTGAKARDPRQRQSHGQQQQPANAAVKQEEHKILTMTQGQRAKQAEDQQQKQQQEQQQQPQKQPQQSPVPLPKLPEIPFPWIWR